MLEYARILEPFVMYKTGGTNGPKQCIQTPCPNVELCHCMFDVFGNNLINSRPYGARNKSDRGISAGAIDISWGITSAAYTTSRLE